MFEEVKEMIDSTIYTNGRGEVTAQNINLAMRAIVEATEGKFVSLEEDGLGSSVVYINVPAEGKELTKEQIAENVVALGKVINGGAALALKCEELIHYPNWYGVYEDVVVASFVTYNLTMSESVIKKKVLHNYIYFCDLDGTVEEMDYAENPASSGPLRVWIPYNNELTEEMLAENADTCAKLTNGYAGLVYMVRQEKLQEEHADGFATMVEIVDIWEAGVMEDVSMAFLGSHSGMVYLLDDGTVEFFSE